MVKYKVIVNPTADRGAAENSIPQAVGFLRKYGLDFDIVRTERPWHAMELTQEAVLSGFNVVVAMGGDGTVNEVINGLMRVKKSSNKSCRLGVLCVGRGNDFAYGVGIPHDLKKNCQILAEGGKRQIDIGRVTVDNDPDGRYFGNGIGMGFDAMVGFVAEKIKFLHGFPSYFIATLKTIFLYFHAPVIQIEYDDKKITQPSLMVSIMNGQRMGGGFMMAPDGKPDDGQLDLCIVGEAGRLKLLGIMPRFMKGTQAKSELIKTGRASWISIEAIEGVLPAHADGETLCKEGRKLTVELLEKQIEVLV